MTLPAGTGYSVTSPSGAIALPTEIVRLYEAAKRAFIYAEESSRLWDFPSLPLFRDALDHLVEAAAHSDNEEDERAHISAAAEHLGMIVAESLQVIAGRRILEVEKLDRRGRWRGIYRKLPSREEVRRHTQEITEAMILGRQGKAKQSVEGWIAANAAFEKAYTRANFLYARIDEAPLRARPIVLAIGPVALVILGAILAKVFG
ncbi:MAG TPA: hypothetical protein VGQ85_04640 [Candidatus Limnocylindrales bacterium]|nr:hypothetical protein [Candidatus Limnocylindrales bacterium]